MMNFVKNSRIEVVKNNLKLEFLVLRSSDEKKKFKATCIVNPNEYRLNTEIYFSSRT